MGEGEDTCVRSFKRSDQVRLEHGLSKEEKGRGVD